MELIEALEIVVDLAQQNCLIPDQWPEGSPLHQQAVMQNEAIDTVHDFAVNHCGDE